MKRIFAGTLILLTATGCLSASQPQQQGKPEPRQKGDIVAMTYNIRIGLGDEYQEWYRLPDGYLGTLPRVARVIRKEQPTWVAIQEVDEKMHRTGFVDQMKALGELTAMHPAFASKHNFGEKSGWYGLGLLTKEKPLKYRKIELGRTAGDHPRILFAAELKDMIVATTHFPLPQAGRVKAAEIIKKEFAVCDKPVFIGGDFNCEPTSPEYKALSTAFLALDGGEIVTWPSNGAYPPQHIDHIFVDRQHADRYRVLDAYTPLLDPGATDHLPLVVRVRPTCDGADK